MNWSYIAGYFDGEGHVGLHPNKRAKAQLATKGMITTLTWYNSHKASLEAMQDFMHLGRIAPSKKGGFNGSSKAVYGLYISKKVDILTAIDAMLPDLIVKRDAALALRQYLIDHVDETRARNFGKLLEIPREDYYRWYVEEGQSFADIARHIDATPSGVGRVLKVLDIPRRPKGGFQQKGTTKSPETIARMKEGRAKLWADPEYAARMREQLALGRQAPHSKGWKKPTMQGEKHPQSKLSDATTAIIRQRYALGGISMRTLAGEYQVSERTIFNIVHNKIRTLGQQDSPLPSGQAIQLDLLAGTAPASA